MSGQQPARVGDVIEHGQPIPGNVAELSDSSSTNGWGRWVRSVNGLWNWAPTADDVESAELRVGGCTEAVMTDLDSGCLPYRVEAVSYTRPLTVVEVDPEPQPAEPGLRDQLLSMWQEYATSSDVVDDAHLVRWVNALIENLGYASRRLKRVEVPESGPVVLSLPQVPDGAVALVGETGSRYVRDPLGKDRWRLEVAGNVPGLPVIEVFRVERSVTVEFAPPREPRTWAQIDRVDDLPLAVAVHAPGQPVERWTRDRRTRTYDSPDAARQLELVQLRHLGEVREVLDA